MWLLESFVLFRSWFPCFFGDILWQIRNILQKKTSLFQTPKVFWKYLSSKQTTPRFPNHSLCFAQQFLKIFRTSREALDLSQIHRSINNTTGWPGWPRKVGGQETPGARAVEVVEARNSWRSDGWDIWCFSFFFLRRRYAHHPWFIAGLFTMVFSLRSWWWETIRNIKLLLFFCRSKTTTKLGQKKHTGPLPGNARLRRVWVPPRV